MVLHFATSSTLPAVLVHGSSRMAKVSRLCRPLKSTIALKASSVMCVCVWVRDHATWTAAQSHGFVSIVASARAARPGDRGQTGVKAVKMSPPKTAWQDAAEKEFLHMRARVPKDEPLDTCAQALFRGNDKKCYRPQIKSAFSSDG